MNATRLARICLSVAVFAILAVAALAVSRTGVAYDRIGDPFHGASQMPGDPTNDSPAGGDR